MQTLRKHKLKIVKKGKEKKTKAPPSSNPPLVVGIDDLGSCTLAQGRFGHHLQRIDPALLGEGNQAHRQYLHCPHLIELCWIGWL
jgi:hypothetical protein